MVAIVIASQTIFLNIPIDGFINDWNNALNNMGNKVTTYKVMNDDSIVYLNLKAVSLAIDLPDFKI